MIKTIYRIIVIIISIVVLALAANISNNINDSIILPISHIKVEKEINCTALRDVQNRLPYCLFNAPDNDQIALDTARKTTALGGIEISGLPVINTNLITVGTGITILVGFTRSQIYLRPTLEPLISQQNYKFALSYWVHKPNAFFGENTALIINIICWTAFLILWGIIIVMATKAISGKQPKQSRF